MLGVMSPLFCETFHKLDLIDSWMTPFIRLSTHSPKQSFLEKKIDSFTKYQKPVIVQLLASSDDLIIQTIHKLYNLGIKDINLNFACPSKTVVNKNGGAALLNQPLLLQKILQKCNNEFPHINLSVKIRTGLYDFEEINTIMPVISEFNLDFIAIHFRTAAEHYNTVPNGFERIKYCVQLAKNIPIIASGDIWTISDIDKVCEISKCQGVMVARGLLKNPFLIREYQGENFGKDKIQLYLETIKNIINQNKQKYWHKSTYLSILKNIFGETSIQFKKAIHLTDNELLNNSFKS